MNRSLKEGLMPEEQQGLEEVAVANENSIQLPLTEEQEIEVVKMVIEDFTAANDARMEKGWGTNTRGEDLDWEGKYTMLIKKYEGHTEPPLKAWMSSGTTRIATAIVETIHSKLLPAVYNDNTIGWKPVEKTDRETVARINKLMIWWVRAKMKLKLTADDIIKYVVMMGTAITKDLWSVVKKDNGQVEQMTTQDPMTGQPVPIMDEMGQPLTNKILDIDEKPKVEIVPLDRFLTQPGQTDLQNEPVIHRMSYFYHDLEEMEAAGAMKNIADKVKPSVDNLILSKMEKELQEAERISVTNIKRRTYPMDVLEWYGRYDHDNDGFAEECVIKVEKETETLISAISLYKISKKGIRPFTKFDFVRRVGKFYAIGVIEMVLPLAEEADACLRQIRDANTIGVQRFGFYDSNGDYNPETHTIAPLKMYPVTDPQRSVYFPDIAVPTERLIQVMSLIMDLIERLTAASSYVMGKESEIVGGSGTATRTQAIISNAEQRFDIPAQRLRESFAELLTHLLCQVQMNMPEGMEKNILGEDGQPIFEEGSIIKDRILAEMDGYVEGDPGNGDKNTQRQIASFLYSTLLQNPLIMSDPVKIYSITADLLESNGKSPEEYLGPRPSMLDFDSPADENTLMREGRFTDVRAHMTENHIEHITVHSLPMQTADLQNWNPTTVQYLQQHILEHQNFMSQMLQLMAQNQNQSGKQSGQPGQNPNAPAGTNPSGTPDVTQNAPNQAQGAAMGGPMSPPPQGAM